MNFHERIREQRMALGYTQSDIAKMLGIAVSTYAHYESGNRTPDLEKACQLCSILNITIEDRFPVIRTIEIPAELLSTLSATKENIATKLQHIVANKENYDVGKLLSVTKPMIVTLKCAIDPVQEIWDQTMKCPDVDFPAYDENRTLLRVYYNEDDWELLSSSLTLYSKLINLVFENKIT